MGVVGGGESADTHAHTETHSLLGTCSPEGFDAGGNGIFRLEICEFEMRGFHRALCGILYWQVRDATPGSRVGPPGGGVSRVCLWVCLCFTVCPVLASLRPM
jgi:hypothetical protein